MRLGLTSEQRLWVSGGLRLHEVRAQPMKSWLKPKVGQGFAGGSTESPLSQFLMRVSFMGSFRLIQKAMK